MQSVWERAKRVARALACSLMLAGVAVAQETGAPTPPCASNPAAGSIPPVNLAILPDCWPPPCQGCDDRIRLHSNCPDPDDYYLVPPRPSVYVSLEGAALRRDPTHSLDFASLGLLPTGTVNPTNVVLSTSDFNYDLAAAGRLVVGHTFNECFQIEGVYLGVSQADNMAAVRDNTPNAPGGKGNLFSPFGGFGNTPILGLDYNNFAQIRYTSSLQSAEVNLRRQLPMPPGKLTSSILFGVRYMNLPEDFQYDTHSDITKSGAVVNNGALNSIHVATGNEMVGPQIGALFEFYSTNHWWVNFEIKGAVMNNQAHQSTDYTNVDNGTTTVSSGNRREDHTAFAEELALVLVYRWTPRLATRIGYQALWLQDTALAPDNLNTNIDILTQGPAQLNYRSSTVYHGPFAGIEFGW